MSTSATPFGPYPTPEELARGKRKVLVSLAVTVCAVALSAVASRTTDDGRLVVVYLAAAALHLVAGLAASIRWSRTPDFGSAR